MRTFILHDDLIKSLYSKEETIQYWRNNDFYADDTVVLGLDMGIEGIGICIRRGSKILYCKSLLVNTPEAGALAERRALRASRHTRKNRRTRLSRLKKLFASHQLPWVDGPALLHTDPYLLRHRAVNKNGLASPEALAACIRNLVTHRGYDYFAMSNTGGEFPWGESTSFSDAKKWLSSAFIDENTAELLKDTVAPLLEIRAKELNENELEEWHSAIDARLKWSCEHGINTMLAEYASKIKKHREYNRARGNNYPRAQVEAHLRLIIEKHQHFIPRTEEFLKALFLDCNTPSHKKEAIFHFNRKTPREAERHFEKKVKDCPFTAWLSLPSSKCGTMEDKSIRLWKLLDFTCNRRFDWDGNENTRRCLPPTAIAYLAQTIQSPDKLQWRSIKAQLDKILKPDKLKSNEWNKNQIEQLKNIVCPSAANLRGRSSLSAAAAEKLYHMISENETDFEPTNMEQRRKDSGLYIQRAQIVQDRNSYPQVQVLLGSLTKQGKLGGNGFLHKLFHHTLKDQLGGKTVPDYCIIERIGDMPRNQKQRKEIEDEQKKRRDDHEKRMAEYNLDPKNPTMRLRMKLHHQQRGSAKYPAICPFTGESLGTDPLSANLELAHLYPDSRGGLAMEDNLVLTTRATNEAMGKRTPKEAAQAKLVGWLTWEGMLKQIEDFRWGKRKRELFAFEPSQELSFPDFGNITRTSQLARQLRNRIAMWMGIADDEEKIRTSIGNPTGTYTAAARRSWINDHPEEKIREGLAKDRSEHTHHRVDAAILSFIPPAFGLNDIRCKGIFTSKLIPKDNKGLTIYLPTICALPELCPTSLCDLIQDDECPVEKLRSQSRHKSLGDSTFWKVLDDGSTRQRTVLDPNTKKISGATLRKTLSNMYIPERDIPSEQELEAWISSAQLDKDNARPLRLNNGTIVKNIHKFDAKGSFNNPLGWSGNISEDGIPDQLRSLKATNSKLELFLAWSQHKNPKKSTWKYFTRIVPTKTAMQGLKRLGIPWKGRHNAPQTLIDFLNKNKVTDLREFYLGKLPPFALKVGEFSKGDRFRLNFTYELKSDNKEQGHDEAMGTTSDAQSKKKKERFKTWGEVSAIQSDSCVKFQSITHKNTDPKILKAAGELASLLALLPAPEEAIKRNRQAPSPPKAIKKNTKENDIPFHLE